MQSIRVVFNHLQVGGGSRRGDQQCLCCAHQVCYLGGIFPADELRVMVVIFLETSSYSLGKLKSGKKKKNCFKAVNLVGKVSVVGCVKLKDFS